MNTETVHKMCKHCKCITRKALTTKKLFVTQIFFLHLNSYHACSLFVQVLSVSTTYLIILFIQLNYCRMKKVISTLLFFVITSIGFTQTTYYWVGGAGPGTFTSSSNWNTSLDGSGTSRATAAADDILIFDGANTGGTLPTTGLVNVTTATNNFGQLIIQNNAQVHFSRTSTGSGTVTINGGVGDDFIVDATSTLTMGGPLGNYDVFIVLATGATGKINGTIHLGPLSTTVHPRAYITAPAVNSLIFESGSQIHINDSTATSGFNGSVANSILFKTGASLYYYAGRSPIGSSSTIQFSNFEPGSNFYVRGTNRSYLDGTSTYSSSSWVNAKTLANLYIENGATLFADGAVYKIENLRINNGCTFMTHLTGNTPVLGNLIVNGTLVGGTGGTTNAIVMGGPNPQTISGTGSINILSFVVANHSEVTLEKSLTVSNQVNIVGKLNFGTHQISGAATFTARANTSIADAPTTNITAGSFLATTSAALTGNTGLSVTCTTPGVLSPGTNCVGFGTGFIYLSKPALMNATGATFVFKSDSATLSTDNANGFNTTNGSVTTTGVRSFQSGVNYVINAATNSPFGFSDGSNTALTGNITLNAPVTTNNNVRVSGTLTLNNGKLTVRSTDTLRMLSPTGLAGAPFSNSKYIALEKSGANVGSLRIDGITSNAVFPIGSTTHYLPATITTTVLDTFIVQAFEGLTEEGTPDGTPMTALKKAKVVDAVWNFNRISNSNTSACGVTLSWPASLEGSSFSGFANNQIGISRNNGTAWEVVTGNGDNMANTVTTNFTAFSPFAIGEVGFILPVKLYNLAAKAEANTVRVKWNVENEINVENYIVERSNSGYNFHAIATVNASNSNQYSIIDGSPLNVNYYRIKVIGKNGNVEVSNIISIRLNSTKGDISIFPNPVKGKIVNIQLSNMEMGKASIKIYNSIGQLVNTQSFVYDGANLLKSILLPNNSVKGIYTIVVDLNNKNAVKKTFLVD